MATQIPIQVRCPRCAEKIELQLHYSVRLIQTEIGRKAFITADTGFNGIEHTCPPIEYKE